jgi:opacity protein-like surface antigen
MKAISMLQNKCYLLFIALILFLSSLSAFATSGIYLTLESGIGNQTGLPSAAEIGAIRSRTTLIPSAYRAGLGYNHDFSSSIGIGLDFALGRYGNKTYMYPNGKTYVHSDTLEFLPFLQWHFHQLDLIGKIGGIRQTLNISGVDAQPNETQIAPELAVGVAYNFTSHLALTVTYARVFKDQIHSFNHLHNQSPSMTEWLVGLRYSCGSE